MGGGGHWVHCQNTTCPLSDDPRAENSQKTQGLVAEEQLQEVAENNLEVFRECTTVDGECEPVFHFQLKISKFDIRNG